MRALGVLQPPNLAPQGASGPRKGRRPVSVQGRALKDIIALKVAQATRLASVVRRTVERIEQAE